MVWGVQNFTTRYANRVLLEVQEHLGRDFGGVRFGPRPIDLDIIFYGNQSYKVSLHYNPEMLYPEC